MATPSPKEDNLYSLIEQLEGEFRWCTQHPNDVSSFEIEQLMQAIKDIETECKSGNATFYKNFMVFKKEFEKLAQKPKEVKPGDFQKFEDMIQQLLRDLS